MMPIDPVRQSEELTQIFFNLSNAVDNFRLSNFGTLSAAEQQRLKDQAQALAMRGQQSIADTLAAIAEGIQPHLQNIKQATKDATDALAHLNDIAKAMKIVDAAVALVSSVAVGDLPAIGDNVQGLVEVISG